MSDERNEVAGPASGGTGTPGATPAGETPGGGEPPAGSPPTRSRAVVVAVSVLVLVAAAAFAFFKVPAFHALIHPHGGGAATGKVAKAAEKYTCGMHPFIVSDKPGKCPICGMTLTKIEEAPPPAGAAGSATAPGAAGGERKILFYRNPMNPSVTSPVPMKDEMGMDYVPVYSDEAAGGQGGAVAGYSTIKVGAEALKLAGVQTAPAVREKIARSVRTVGIVVADERRVRRVQTKIEGWIEKLHVNFTGQLVAKGQPLLEIYSPELVAGQREYVLALAMYNRMKENPYPEEREMSAQLVQSSRRRLELFDVPPGAIEELEKTGNPRRTVTLNAPASGYVTAKDVFEGSRVMPGMELFTVTDLSRVWIEADIYEYEARAVRVGQPATLASSYDPGLRLKGRVAFVHPTISAETRTLKVRFDFPNPGLRLKPQMYADVSLDLESASGVVIPDSALIDTGLRQIVFVDLGGGSLEPREVKAGVRGDGKAQILSGVKEGERVAVRANFLLDSESRLRSALAGMTGGGAGAQQSQGKAPAQGHAGHGGGQ